MNNDDSTSLGFLRINDCCTSLLSASSDDHADQTRSQSFIFTFISDLSDALSSHRAQRIVNIHVSSKLIFVVSSS